MAAPKKPETRVPFRKVPVSVWGAEGFRRLSPIRACGQGLWFWLTTGPMATPIPGIVIGGRAAMAERLRWLPEDFDRAFEELDRERMARADWEAPLVWLPDAIHSDEPENPNQVKGWRKSAPYIPECELRLEAFSYLRMYCKRRGAMFLAAFDKVFPEVLEDLGERYAERSPEGSRNQEQEQEQEKEQEQEQEYYAASRVDSDSGVAGLGEVSTAFEQVFGTILAGRELLNVRHWIGRGVPAGRIAEAIEAIGRADPKSIRSRWGAVLALVRDTPPGAPMEWQSGKQSENPRAVNGAGERALSPREVLNMRTPEEA